MIWPDFTRIHTKGNSPILSLHTVDDVFSIGGFQITPFKVNHPSYATGYLINDGEVQLIFTGDSGPTPAIWKVANASPQLKAIFTEVSFPSRLESLAKASGHFTLKTLIDDIKQLTNKNTPIYINHLKPLFLQELLDEFHSQANPNMKLLHADDELQFL